MAGVGIYGGYQPFSSIGGGGGGPGYDYPMGPSQWLATQTWPLRPNSRVYAVDLNTQLSSAVAFLSRKPMYQGVQQTVQSIPNNAATAVTMDTEVSDSWQMHSTETDVSQAVVPFGCDGIWLVQGSVPLAAANGSMYETFLYHNGSVSSNGEQVTSTGFHVGPGVADLIVGAAGDSFQLGAYQNSGNAINTYINSPTSGGQYVDGVNPILTARWVAANNSLPGGVITIQVPVATVNGITWSVNQQVTLTLPNSGTWTSLQEATSAQFNSDIRNSVLFLANVPACRVRLTGSAPTVTSGTTIPGTQVTGLTSNIDNWSAWNSSTNTWTCPLSGDYLVYGQAGFPLQASAFSVNATLQAVQSSVTTNYTGAGAYGTWPQAIVMRTLRFTAGDTLKLFTSQNFGSSLTPATNNNSRLFTLWLGA